MTDHRWRRQYRQLCAQATKKLGLKVGRPGKSKLYGPIKLMIIQFMLLLRPVQGLRIVGKHNLPEHGPAIYVCNHVSFWDHLAALYLLRRHRITAFTKSDYFKSPVWKPFFRGLGMLPLKRGDKEATAYSLAIADHLVDAGSEVGIYPEGTRTKDKRRQTIHRWYPPVLGSLVLRHPGVPVIPLGVKYKYRRFRRSITMYVGEPKMFGPHATPPEIADVLRLEVIAMTKLPFDDRPHFHEKNGLPGPRQPSDASVPDPTHPITRS